MTSELKLILETQSQIIKELETDIEKLKRLWKLETCSGCNKLFTNDDLMCKGDELFCVGCREIE